MSNIAQAIGWKFDHQSGMRCKEIDGVMTIVEFPDGIPSKKDQDSWMQEYEDHAATSAPEESITADELFGTLVTKGILNVADRPSRI